MGFWTLIQVVVNLFFFAGFILLWIRTHRAPKDDPRLSKGLQLLQSKISILEDLSDRTETQVQQLTALLEAKYKDVQQMVLTAEQEIQRIQQTTQKSLEVAKIFKDKIPHHEIIERQKTIKYVKAARLSHQGHSIEEIAQQVDLSTGELEFIFKVNKDQLMFCEDSLPEWANDEAEKETLDITAPESHGFLNPLDKVVAFKPAVTPTVQAVGGVDLQALQDLGAKFHNASMTRVADHAVQMPQNIIDYDKNLMLKNKSAPVERSQSIEAEVVNAQGGQRTAMIRPMEFKKIDSTR